MKTLLGILANRHRVTYPLLTLTGAFADGTPSTSYSSSITISGGNGVYSLTGGDGVVSGSLPPGLSLSISGSSLTLSGTFPSTGGPWSFTVGVDSGDSQTATSAQSVKLATAARMLITGPRYGSLIYDPTTNSCTSQSYPSGVDQFRIYGGNLVKTDDGRIFLVGSNSGRAVIELVDDAWESRADLPSTFHVGGGSYPTLAGAIGSTKIVAVAVSITAYNYVRVATYDLALDAWTDLGDELLTEVMNYINAHGVHIANGQKLLFLLGSYAGGSAPYLLFDGMTNTWSVPEISGIDNDQKTFIPSANGWIVCSRSSWKEFDLSTSDFNSHSGSTGMNAGIMTRAVVGDVITTPYRQIDRSSYTNSATLTGLPGTTGRYAITTVGDDIYCIYSNTGSPKLFKLDGTVWYDVAATGLGLDLNSYSQACEV